MAGSHRIDTPRGSIIQTGETSCRLVWNSDFGQKMTDMFNRKQGIVDSEVLQPFNTPENKYAGKIRNIRHCDWKR